MKAFMLSSVCNRGSCSREICTACGTSFHRSGVLGGEFYRGRIDSAAFCNRSILLDYVRYQFDQLPMPSTVNHRLAVLGCLYRFHYGCQIH
jgi:hypothetical protein